MSAKQCIYYRECWSPLNKTSLEQSVVVLVELFSM